MWSYALLLVALSSLNVSDRLPVESGFEGAVTAIQCEEQEGYVIYTATLPYLSIKGVAKTGQARVIVKRSDLESNKLLPIFFHAHYEKDPNGAKHWCDRGWAVVTAHYSEKYPADVSPGDGFNLAHAIVQWARRVPFLDRSRLHIDGGSQGGYMALMMSADCFPVTATTADCPVVNWAYNFSYIASNKEVSQYKKVEAKKSPLPFVSVVTGLADQGVEVFGPDFSSEAWYAVSPIACLDQITNPVMVVCATGDMLVPMEQMTRSPRYLRPYDPAQFPAGYQRDFDALTVCTKARKTFDDLVPKRAVKYLLIPLQANSYESDPAFFFEKDKKPPEKGPAYLDRPWSPKHQWSICVLDEGPPGPLAGHMRYMWVTGPESFVDAHQKQVPSPAILNAAKLLHLMERYSGKLSMLPALADGKPGNRLNFAAAEKRDVVTGLLDYAAMGKKHTARLKKLYKACPLHPLGATLDLDALKN